MSNDQVVQSGGCLCGAVRYAIRGDLRDVVICHCTMCQKLHGSIGAHTKAAKSNITFSNDTGLAWFSSSERARRGFCKTCGSSLFWDPADQPAMGILAGSLDSASGLKTIGHIFIGEKCWFFEVSDASPQFTGSSDGALDGDAL